MKNGKMVKKRISYYLLILLFILLCTIFGIGVLKYRIGAQDVYASLSEEDGTIPYKVSWQWIKYKGEYVGELNDGLPEGEGVFTSADGSFSYSGQWTEGCFNGTATITYPNGEIEEGKYRMGRRHGLCRTYYPDNTYDDKLYIQNQVFGNCITYKNDQPVEKSLIVNGISSEELMEEAQDLADQLLESQKMTSDYISVSGIVEFVEENTENCNFRINSEGLGMVTGSYGDSFGNGLEQAIMPNFKIGDKVMLYGYYNGYLKDGFKKDLDYYGYSCFNIEPVFGIIISENDVSNPFSFTMNNPYLYMGMRVEMSFTIDRCIRNGKNYYIFGYMQTEDHSSDTYVLHITSEDNELFLTGRNIDIHGYYFGQYKDKKSIENSISGITETEYRKYPLVEVIEFEKK